MADRLAARRAGANSFFLAVQSVLATLLAALAIRPTPATTELTTDRVLLTLAVTGGLVLAGAWWLLLTSYRRLSAAKFAVISDIEAKYLKVRPYTDEWTQLKKSAPAAKNPFARIASLRDRYAELGVVEQLVPAAFAILYVLLALRLWLQ